MESHIISSVNLVNVLKSEKNNNGSKFTIKSLKTNKEFTYRIDRSSYKKNWYTHISVETGYDQFTRLGTYFNGKIFDKKNLVTSPSATAISFILSKVENNQFDYLDKNIELMHTGHCLKCGRVLTDSESIRTGLGPICRSMKK
jgi:hypothetical protein